MQGFKLLNSIFKHEIAKPHQINPKKKTILPKICHQTHLRRISRPKPNNSTWAQLQTGSCHATSRPPPFKNHPPAREPL